MGVFSRAVRPAQSRALVPFDGSALNLPSPVGSAAGAAGQTVTQDTALSIMTFYRGVQLIADTIALLPLQAVKQAADGTRSPLTVKPWMVTNPFFGLNLQEGVTQIIASLILRGNAYLVPGQVAGGEVVSWRIVPTDSMAVKFGDKGREYRLGSQELDPAYVTHLTGFMMPGNPVGVSLLEYTRASLGLTLALTDSAATLFQNGVMASGVIGMDVPLDPNMARQVADQFRQNHAGVRNAHAPIVLGGGAKFTPISMTPEDTQFMEARRYQQGEIATLLGIPPHLLGIVDKTTSWGTGIEVQGRAFVDYTLNSYIQRLQTMFTAWLDEGVWAQYDTDQLTRPETKQRYENYAQAIQWGFMNPDEARGSENLPPIPGGLGRQYYKSIQMDPAGQADPAAQPTDDAATDVSDPVVSGGS